MSSIQWWCIPCTRKSSFAVCRSSRQFNTYFAYLTYLVCCEFLVYCAYFEYISNLLALFQHTSMMVMKKTTSVMSHTTRIDVPLRANHWFQQSDEILSSGDFAGICINTWNWAKIWLFLVHSLRGLPCNAIRDNFAWQCWWVGEVLCTVNSAR